MTTYFSQPSLLQSLPLKRAAYSDRIAWIMAEISRLVYEPLPIEITVENHISLLKAAIARSDYESALKTFVSQALSHGFLKNSPVETALLNAGLQLLDSFSCEGTEAMLLKIEPAGCAEGMLVLVFRGTQPDIKDVMADIKANLVPAEGGGRVHYGFWAAFKKIEDAITESLERHKDCRLPLYITGHSLGGALAMIAARRYGADSTGAAYTFGAPRVGDLEFFKDVKMPVYRIVNAADGVARVPFGPGLTLLIALIRLLPINGTKRIADIIQRYFSGYTDFGSLYMLTAPAQQPDQNHIPYLGLELLQSPSIFGISRVVFPRLIATRFKATALDHSSSAYAEKLLAHALRRSSLASARPSTPSRFSPA